MEKSNIYQLLLTYKYPMSINFDSSDVIIIEIILSNRVNLVEMIMMMNRTLFQTKYPYPFLTYFLQFYQVFGLSSTLLL